MLGPKVNINIQIALYVIYNDFKDSFIFFILIFRVRVTNFTFGTVDSVFLLGIEYFYFVFNITNSVIWARLDGECDS